MSDAVLLLRQLINCKSVTPEHGGALDLAENFLRDAGFSAQRLPAGGVDNLWAADGESPALLLAGHVDVVPPGDLAQWESPPFEAEERGGFIYGRGAADMKSGVAALLCAARELRGRGVAVLLTSDEEGAAIHGTRHVAEWRKQNGGAQIPFALLGEPTCEKEFGDTIKIGRRGSLTARITVRGKQTHAAYPHKGDNPIHRLAAALPEILHRAAAAAKLGENAAGAGEKTGGEADFPPLTAQIVMLKSGVADNVIPPAAAATVNFRYAPPDTPALLRPLVEEPLQNAASGQWECEWIHGAAPFLTPRGGALAGALQDAIFAVCGRRAAFSTGGGTSDGRFLREICGEIAEFGVINETMHAPNERAECDSVRKLAEIYRRAGMQLLAEKVKLRA